MAVTPLLPLLRVAAAHVAKGANTDYDGIANYAFNPEKAGAHRFLGHLDRASGNGLTGPYEPKSALLRQ
jgi:hypothetical protein